MRKFDDKPYFFNAMMAIVAILATLALFALFGADI